MLLLLGYGSITKVRLNLCRKAPRGNARLRPTIYRTVMCPLFFSLSLSFRSWFCATGVSKLFEAHSLFIAFETYGRASAEQAKLIIEGRSNHWVSHPNTLIQGCYREVNFLCEGYCPCFCSGGWLSPWLNTMAFWGRYRKWVNPWLLKLRPRRFARTKRLMKCWKWSWCFALWIIPHCLPNRNLSFSFSLL